MEKIDIRHVVILKRVLTILNFIIVFYHGTLFLLSSKYISENGYARDFLNNLSYMPTSPKKIFFGSLICYGLILVFMNARQQVVKSQKNELLALLEVVIMIVLIIQLKGSYTGIVFLVFADIVYDAKMIKHSFGILSLIFLVLLLSDYNIISKIIDAPSIDSYLNFYPLVSKSMILFFKNIFNSLNIVLFIFFLVVFLLVQQKKEQNIKDELKMIYQVNTELKNYAALTEKIGEDNERKRISREIHDTLGHALTGISAGVDACIALIDIDSDKTKQQLLIVSNVVRQGIKDVRRSLYKLRPGALENRTLKDGLEKMIDEYESVSKIKINLSYEWDSIDFENTKEDIIFRIVQESITNSLRHGHATFVDIVMSVSNSHYMILIQDNGHGCSEIKEGYGLKQMKERIAIINGSIMFENNNGFKIFIAIPKNRGEKND